MPTTGGVREHRARLVAGLEGVVCDVGSGSGLTFAHYPPGVTRVWAVEPEPTLREHARTAAVLAPVPVTVVDAAAEALPFPDASMDAVVLCLVLCSVTDVARSLLEVRRVLRPSGQLRFYEHVRSSHAVLALAQDVVAPAWARLAGGCHPNRDAVAAMESAGFHVDEVHRFGFGPGHAPRVAHVLGRARRDVTYRAEQ